MWRVTLNCSWSQTPRLPARPPRRSLPRQGPGPPESTQRLSPLAAGRRVRPPSPARHTAWGQATEDPAPLPFPGDAQRDGRCSPARPPRPLVSSPLRPSVPGARPAITWALHRVVAAQPRARSRVLAALGPTSSAPDPPLQPPPPGRKHSVPHHLAQRRCFRRRNEHPSYWLRQAPPSSGEPVTASVSEREGGSAFGAAKAGGKCSPGLWEAGLGGASRRFSSGLRPASGFRVGSGLSFAR